MTIFCDWPRAIACNECRSTLVLPKTATKSAAYDAGMRAAGWVEYSPRFVAQLEGRVGQAPPLHVCDRCVVVLDVRVRELLSASIDIQDVKTTASDHIRRAMQRFERVMAGGAARMAGGAARTDQKRRARGNSGDIRER